jgi:vancomycin resistance protein YoaR
MDATIAEGSIDFKFQNNREYPICLSAEATGNTLKIRILGKKESSDSLVKLVSEVVEEFLPEVEDVVLDTSVPEGETQIVREARKGLKVIVYRYTYSSNGELLDREKISEDIYRPVRGIVKMSNKYYNRDKNIEIN